jgi:hypothetical protein
MRDLCHLPINVTYTKKLQSLDQGDLCHLPINVGFMLGYMRKQRIKYVIFILGCVLKFRILLTI